MFIEFRRNYQTLDRNICLFTENDKSEAYSIDINYIGAGWYFHNEIERKLQMFKSHALNALNVFPFLY